MLMLDLSTVHGLLGEPLMMYPDGCDLRQEA